MRLVLRYAVRSDVGLLREGNEDSAYAGPHLLAVADGMGGYAAGEVASATTIAEVSLLDGDRVDEDVPEEDLIKAMAAAVANANMRLQEMSISDPSVQGMGTTLTAVLWAGNHAGLCHIGDSRAYLLRGGELYQITRDHTLVQSLVDEGRITEDDVATHPQRSLLLRALDGRTLAEPDLSVHETMAGDRYLLCSDGLCGVVTRQTIEHVLNSIRDPEQAALQLIDLAIRGGGPDNITGIVADVVDTDAGGPPPTLTPVRAGAAAGETTTEQRTAARHDSPAGRARRLTQTKPQQAVPEDGDGWNGHNRRGRRPKPDEDFGDDDYGDGTHPARRRWPIVTMTLVVLAVVVFGGGYVAWRYTQGQYYVGEDTANGQVAIYRGVNQDIAGISLSGLYQNTGIEMTQVPKDQLSAVQSTIAAPNLTTAQRAVSSIKSAVAGCKSQYAALASWQTTNSAYQAAKAKAKIDKKFKNTLPVPGQQPSSPNVNCQPSTAFGISASALPGGSQATATPSAGATPSATASPSPKASSTKRNTR